MLWVISSDVHKLGHNKLQQTAAAPARTATAALIFSVLAAPVAVAMPGETLDVDVVAAVTVGEWTVYAPVV